MQGVTLRPSRPADLAFITELERDPENRDFIGQWSDGEHLAAIAREALGQFGTRVLALEGVSCVWLNVLDWNVRAQRVYAKLGFARFDPGPEEAARCNASGEAPGEGAFRMRLAKC